MIDTSKEYWTGSCTDDIDEYLRLYSVRDDIDLKLVFCHSCGTDIFGLNVDQDEVLYK